MKLAVICILTFFFSIQLFSQTIVIRDFNTDEAIVGVAIFNVDKSKSTVSDLNGRANLDIFSSDELLSIQHVSYFSRLVKKSEIPSVFYLEPREQNLDEVVISASKFEQSKKEVPQRILSIRSEDIVFTNPQTSADLLANSGQVFVQKSQLGGGSPIIRGFSTNRLLISVDGVRMNNAIFRGGNVQNVISIDPFSISNTEVILGAGSVIYGSDAIGGVMNFYTTNPKLSMNDSLNFTSNLISRYASASNEKTAHLDLNFGLSKWAFYTSASYTDFDDLEMGKRGPEDYLRPEYVITNNGVDQIIENDEPRIQKFSGYDQINVLQKVHYKANEKISYDLGLHYSRTSNYPRYDRLIRYENGELRSAEWDYGPQKWFLGNFQLTKRSSSSNLYDKIKFTAAYQNFQEGRIDRNLNSAERRVREENVDAISGNIDFEKSVSERAKIFYGAEYVYNKIGSEGFQLDIESGAREKIASRYPDGSSWHSAATYFSYKFKPNPKFTLQTGLRYNHVFIKADLTDNNQFFNLPFNNADLNNGNFSGTFGFSWIPNEMIGWKFNLTSAFRAPNIDDIGKIFDSEPGSVVVPNNNLKPEYAYGGDLGLKLNLSKGIEIDMSTYYTYLDNALVRRDFTINGESQIVYDGELSDVQAIQNASKAWIYGFEVGANVQFTEFLSLRSQYSVIGGSEEDENGSEVPVRHVAPAFGNTHLIWDSKKWKFDLFALYNNELSFSQLALSEREKDFIYALDENGNPYSPSWSTLNFRSQYQLNSDLLLTASIENITNKLYRPYSSGISAPGRNLIVSVKYSIQ